MRREIVLVDDDSGYRFRLDSWNVRVIPPEEASDHDGTWWLLSGLAQDVYEHRQGQGKDFDRSLVSWVEGRAKDYLKTRVC